MKEKKLSLADIVNLALIVLTVLGIFLAAWSLKVAKQTLEDARQASVDQKQQFDQQQNESQQKFEQQREQSKLQFEAQMLSAGNSLKALNKAKDSLAKESSLLSQLQETSKSQLAMLGQQTKLQSELAQGPLPEVQVFCDDQVVADADTLGDDPLAGKGFPKVTVDSGGLIRCFAVIRNNGRTNLEKLRLEVTTDGNDQLLEAVTVDESLKIDRLNTWVRVAKGHQSFSETAEIPSTIFRDKTDLLDLELLPPYGSTGKQELAPFTVRVATKVNLFVLSLSLEAKNAKTVHPYTLINVTRLK